LTEQVSPVHHLPEATLFAKEHPREFKTYFRLGTTSVDGNASGRSFTQHAFSNLHRVRPVQRMQELPLLQALRQGRRKMRSL